MPKTDLDAGAADHPGITGTGDAPRLPGAAVQGGARRGHLRARAGIGRSRAVVDGSFRADSRAPVRRHRRRREHRRRPQLVRPSLRPGELVRLRPARLGPQLSADGIADEWLRMTFTHDDRFVAPVKAMMLGSREAVVDYMTPLGLHHLMAGATTTAPAPGSTRGSRADWSRSTTTAPMRGIGFDRTATGSNAVAQYAAAARSSPTRRSCPRPCCSGSTTCPGIAG